VISIVPYGRNFRGAFSQLTVSR